ncbi:MAG: GNAT family N-acetyltransferase [Actinobacteria bacterium]|uniref:Unannotated protein n=1 Tax=freshwater metagenome TaxID=449393 RepID=A0A6J7D1B4_9ZZZZ|nr:GNAT family N-acetyltransferase [Actinomycetota bacterium]
MDRTIEGVGIEDLAELLPLMRSYCDFYEVNPADDDLETLARRLISNPGEGIQLIARNDDGEAVGFATVYWTWQTLSAERVGVMNDLFVAAESRGSGWADALIEACAQECRTQQVTSLVWQTALDNLRAQAVYDRVGAVSERWLDYSLDVSARPDG